MDPARVSVRNVRVVRHEVDRGHADVAEALATLFAQNGRGGSPRLPLAPTRLEFELGGAATAVANALRRVLAQELLGHCLTFDRDGLVGANEPGGTTDPFMQDADYLRTRLRMVPLAPGIPEEVVRTLRYSLHHTNPTSEVVTLYAGDLQTTAGQEPAANIFNPTHELAFLQPGKTLHIRDIRIDSGTAAQDAAFAVAIRATAVPLDLEEAPRSETHDEGGAEADYSGYRQSSLVADPRRHRVSCVLPAVPKSTRLVLEVGASACRAVVQRLGAIRALLAEAHLRPAAVEGGLQMRNGDGHIHVAVGEKVRGHLFVKKETHTTGNLLVRAIHELFPRIEYAAYVCTPHERGLALTVERSGGDAHSLVREVLLGATDAAAAVFRAIEARLSGVSL